MWSYWLSRCWMVLFSRILRLFLLLPWVLFSLNSFSSEADERRGRRKGEKEEVWRRIVQGIIYGKRKSVKDNLTEIQLPINAFTVAVKASIRLKQLWNLSTKQELYHKETNIKMKKIQPNKPKPRNPLPKPMHTNFSYHQYQDYKIAPSLDYLHHVLELFRP